MECGDRRPVSQVRYTEAGDAALERAIADLLAEVTARASRVPQLDALMLGGSLGRGEGTYEHVPGGDRLASDVELYLVGRSSTLRDAARRLEREVAADGLGDVSAAWLHPGTLASGRGKNLSWKPSRTIRLYELAEGSRPLVGDPPEIRAIDPATLPLAEGVRLVLNRLAEAAPDVADGAAGAARWTDKILMACGDTLLLDAGAYTVRYRHRAARVSRLEPSWPMPEGWRDMLVAAYERKLTGRPVSGHPEVAERVDQLLVATLRAAVPRAANVEVEPLRDFVSRYVMGAARAHELLRYLPPVGPAATYEGLVVLARAARAGLRPTARALRQALAGRPMSLVLQAAALPLYLGISGRDPALVEAARDGLGWGGMPAAELTRASSAGALAHLLRRHWSVAT